MINDFAKNARRLPCRGAAPAPGRRVESSIDATPALPAGALPPRPPEHPRNGAPPPAGPPARARHPRAELLSIALTIAACGGSAASAQPTLTPVPPLPPPSSQGAEAPPAP